MRVLTVPPTSDGWVVLPICRDRGVGYEGPHGIGCGCPSTTDVLGLVERCKTCDGVGNFLGWDVSVDSDDPADMEIVDCAHCDACGGWLTGFVRVVGVRQIVEYVDDMPDSISLIEAVGLNGPALWRAGNDLAPECDIDLPNAVPGGVAIKVGPCNCPACGGTGADFGSLIHGAPCPTCSDLPRPVTLHGDAPIQEVE